MTVARAPGKLVLSGAYSVLHGGPAIVAAAARFAFADSARPANFVTDEVAAALLPSEVAPFIDASQLRKGERKLGLGSSAAILSASLLALHADRDPALSDTELRKSVFERAFVAHRKAQGGGSGVDVAASVFGGVLAYRLERQGPRIESVELPRGLVIEAWLCPGAASTAALLAAVRALGERDPAVCDALLEQQALAAENALQSAAASDAPRLLAALEAQYSALLALGRGAGVPIIIPALEALAPLAARASAVLLPAGAGGGDIALHCALAPSSPELRRELAARDLSLLDLTLGAPGASRAAALPTP
jgi:phosphomevalonate kinase